MTEINRKPIFENENYYVAEEFKEIEEVNYRIFNKKNGLCEMKTETLPDALYTAYRMNVLVNQFYQGELEASTSMENYETPSSTIN